ncbi:oligosaccharide flippase family protein [Pseudomonas protegens]
MNFTEIKKIYSNNKKVASNYFHMTALQIINSFFYILIYPFVINHVGIESFGLYVFASSIAAYFMVFINFGFDMHATKLISLEPNNKTLHSSLLSLITLSKLLLGLISILIFCIILFSFSFLNYNWPSFLLCFANAASCVFLPTWYFHGMQKMKVLTTIQLIFKLLSLPAIYILVKDSTDIGWYAFSVVSANILSSVAAFIIAARLIQSKLPIPTFRDVKCILHEVQPFFWSSAANTLKQRSIEIIIGSMFGMREIAIYDLANKIFSVPSLIASNINAALFPVMVKNVNKKLIGRIVKIEVFIASLCVASVALIGNWVVDLVSIHDMRESYYLSILLSLNITTYLVVSSYIYFVFVPYKKYNFVLKNQLLSLVSFFTLCIIYLSLHWSIYAVVLALVSSAALEILYTLYLVGKIKDY